MHQGFPRLSGGSRFLEAGSRDHVPEFASLFMPVLSATADSRARSSFPIIACNIPVVDPLLSNEFYGVVLLRSSLPFCEHDSEIESAVVLFACKLQYP